MSPDRWQQINQLFHDTLAHPPAARAEFLALACGADEELRQEVLTLLAAEAKADALLEQPLGVVAADLLSEAVSTAPLALPGSTQLGSYQIIHELGRGGMGEVYLAQDQKLKRRVALKLLPARFTHDPERLHRFRQEARAASALNHPNIVTLFDIGEQEGRHFMATEFVEGQTLRAALRHTRFAAPQALDIVIQAASALEAAHQAGIVHRDVKPENIMLRPDGYVKVLDFGLAKLTEPSSADNGEVGEAATRASDLPASFETRTGVVLGTVNYMSPEQARGVKVDARTDIFSLGIVLYELLTGERPFVGATPNHVLVAILDHEPRPLANYLPQTPPGLQGLLSRTLAKERDERYPSCKELLADLRDLRRRLEFQAETAGRTPRRRTGALLALAALVLVAITAFWYFNRRPPLTERDMILLADFENKTGDTVFDGTLKQALAVQLGQTLFLNLFPEERVRETLRLMERAPDSPVTREAAREICQRQGLKALLIGSLASLGSNYVITLEALNGQSGETLASQQTEAASKEQVLRALGQAAAGLRKELGESLSSMQRFDTQLAQATTSSLEAWRAYALGMKEATKGRFREAIPLFKRAVELDHDFALAYGALAANYNSTAQLDLAVEAAQQAFALRERTTEHEQFRLAYVYYSTATDELDKLIEGTKLWEQTYAHDYLPPS
jgi:serine/threonine protein kinase